MVFLRIENKSSGSYIRIVESYRNEFGRVTQRTLFNLGKLEDYTPEELQRNGRKFFESGGDLKLLIGLDSKEIARYNYGYYQLFVKILRHYGLEVIFARIRKKHKLE